MYSALIPIGVLLVRREHFKLEIDHFREASDKPTMVWEEGREDAPPHREPNMLWEDGGNNAPPHTRSPRQVVLANEYIFQVKLA